MLIYDGNSPESGQRGNLPQHNKGHMWQTHSKHHSQWQKTEIISPKVRNKTKVRILATFIQRSFERITTNCGKFLKRWEYQMTLPASWEISMQLKKQQLEPHAEQ